MPPMPGSENFSGVAQTGIRPGFAAPPKYSEPDFGGPLPVQNKEGQLLITELRQN